MKKRLLTLALLLSVLLGVQAQGELSQWADPSSQYHVQTVVYARLTLDTENGAVDAYGNVNGEIGAFIDDELRAVVSVDRYVGETTIADIPAYIYALRVGGEQGVDEGKSITFKVKDANTGFIYPLELSTDAPVWNGDATMAPSEFITMSYRPTNYVGLAFKDNYPEEGITTRVGESLNIWDYMDLQFGRDPEFPTTRPDNLTIQWDVNGTFSDFLSIDEEGILTSYRTTPQSEDSGEYMPITYSGTVLQGWSGMDLSFQITILPPYVAVESISVPTITLYKGQGLYDITDYVVFNNGDSDPTYTDFSLSVEDPAFVNVRAPYVIPVEIGTAVVTITSRDPELGNNQISSSFEVKVISALESMTYPEDKIEYTINEGWERMNDYVLPLEFIWTTTEDGSSVVDYEDVSYTVVSANPDIVNVEAEEGEVGTIYHYTAVSKGQTTLTFTSVYDPSKQVVVPVYISKAVHGINITDVNGEDPFTKPTPVVTVAPGQQVTATARVFPEDADYSLINFRFVDANWGQLEKTEDDVIMGDVIVADGVATVTFTFNRLPEQEYYLQAVVDNDYMSEIVKIEVVQTVADIIVMNFEGEELADGDEMAIWYSGEEGDCYFFTEVLPEDATNKNLIITVEPESVISLQESDDFGHYFIIHSKGTANITFQSEDNPSIKKTITVHTFKQIMEMWVEMENDVLYNDESGSATLYIYPADADFDHENFVFESYGPYDGLEYVKVEADFNGSYVSQDYNAYVVPLTLLPEAIVDVSWLNIYCIPVDESVEVVPGYEVPISIYERLNFAPGWNWISLISGSTPLKGFADNLVEARSKTQLVYNDPVWGLFGELYEFNNSQAYKVDAVSVEPGVPIRLAVDNIYETSTPGYVEPAVIVPGWNWVSYPYEQDHMISEVFDAEEFAEGDIFLSKQSGLAVIKDGTWENDFRLLPNEGYMVYHNGDTTEVMLPNRYDIRYNEEEIPRVIARKAARRAAAESVWNYDGSQFANTMAIIAQLDMTDDASDYTIGAFVGDECRGEGKVVNGTAYITAMGEAGELISFRLYNKVTGKYADVTTQLMFGDIIGSINEPVLLGTAIPTDVDDVNVAQAIYLCGDVLNLGQYNGVATIMSIDGKVVATTTEASISVAQLPTGVYVVVIDGDNGRTVKKIVKN